MSCRWPGGMSVVPPGLTKIARYSHRLSPGCLPRSSAAPHIRSMAVGSPALGIYLYVYLGVVIPGLICGSHGVKIEFPATFVKASERCTLMSLKQQEAKQHLLTHAPYDGKYWLPIRRHLSHWRWINGEYLGYALSRETEKTRLQRCGVLRVGDAMLDSMRCNHTHPGYGALCNRREPPGRDEADVVGNGEDAGPTRRLYHVIHGDLNWYQARDACRAYGTDLATLQLCGQPAETARRVARLVARLNEREGVLWLGLARSWWRTTHPHHGELARYNWCPLEPMEDKPVVLLDAARGCWRAAQPWEWHSYLCADENALDAQGLYNHQPPQVVQHLQQRADPPTADTGPRVVSAAHEGLGVLTQLAYVTLALVAASAGILVVILRMLVKSRKVK